MREFDIKISKREEDILYILWKADKPLLVSEIVNENITLPTVHTTIRRMLQKGLVKVVNYTKSGNVFGRCYQPSISLTEYEMHEYSQILSRKAKKFEVLLNIVENILDSEDEDTLKKELDGLELIIKQQREKIRREKTYTEKE